MSTAWFTRALVPWYKEHRRRLPWRASKDPYCIWLSEVILQQTRVEQGTAYWQRFVDRYPTLFDLAEASEDEVLRLWQGLGYYSRARNLRKAAQQVARLHGGRFPQDHALLKGLSGVGDYTAAAIGSIAFGLAEPVVDGNVYRVLSRVFGIDTPIDGSEGRVEFRALAANLLDRQAPGDHNQAVMELGALVCSPKSPKCGDCPLASKCIALRTDRIDQLPVKANRTKVRIRYFNYLHVEERGCIHLRKRSGKDIWHGLYELPLLESDGALTKRRFAAVLANVHGTGWTVEHMVGPVKHILSHQHLQARFWRVRPPKGFMPPQDWEQVDMDRLEGHALPRLIERHLLASRT